MNTATQGRLAVDSSAPAYGSLTLALCVFLFLRSVSNGLDRMLGLSFSMALTAGIIALAAVLLPFAMRRPGIFASPILWLLITAAAATAATFAAPVVDMKDAVVAVLRPVYLASFLYILANLRNASRFLEGLHLTLCLVIATVAVVAIGQWATGNTVLVDRADHFARVIGISSHPVQFSIEMSLLVLLVEMIRRKRGSRLSSLGLTLYGLALVAMLLANSRTGLAASAIAVALFLTVRRPVLLPFAAAVATGGLALLGYGSLFADLTTLPDYVLGGYYRYWEYRPGESSMHWRIHHWYVLLEMWRESPWLGFGAGQQVLLSPFGKEAHSQFIEILFETGICGLLAYTGFWISLPLALLRTERDRRRRHDTRGGDAALLWFATYAGITLASIFSVSFNRETLALTYLLCGLFVVLAPEPDERQGSGGL